MSKLQSPIMIEAENISKQYGLMKAVDNLSFACEAGEIVGILGPNGAGKTTTMRIMAGTTPPTSGDAFIAGYHTQHESLPARRQLGYLPENVPLYPEMTVEGYLAFMGRVRRLDDLWERIDQVLEDVAMLEKAESFIGTLSKGMRQRVGLAQALLHDPDVLILDEPTIGLDPAQIVEIRQMIADVGRRRTVLLSTHLLAEVEQICSRVLMIMNGRIYADISLAELKQGVTQLTLQLARPADDASAILATLNGVVAVASSDAGTLELTIDGREETRTLVAETAVSQGWGLLQLTPNHLSLESIFLARLKEAEATRDV